MKELVSILNLKQPEGLVKQLVAADYSFAAWRLPNGETFRFIISLHESVKVSETQISQLASGFLINEYADSHPLKPYHIQADITIINQDISINPNISDVQIDAFKEKIQQSTQQEEKTPAPDQLPANDFEKLVTKAIAEIQSGSFEKVVLSRFRDQSIPDGFSAWDFFETIAEKYKNAFCSLSYLPGRGMWIGATPELLISDNGKTFNTVALAGTKRLDDQKLSEIAWTQKEIEEQALVSRYIINCFKKIRLREFHEHGPKTIQAGNLAHLKTEFVVDYGEVMFERLADQMLELLHPTSAVCGMPIDQTKPWIKEVENYDREFYSGFLGPVNFENSTNLFVNLRCMKIANGLIRFYAGAGLTEDSDPQKEYEETEMKMDVLKRLL